MKQCLLIVFAGWCACAASGADVSLTASATNVSVGQTFTVTVTLNSASPFGIWGKCLKFDPAKLEATAQAGGTFTNYVADSRGLAAINASGEIHAGGYVLGNGSSGSGTLGVFTFQALAAGTTQVTTENKAAGSPFGNVLIPTNGVEVLPNVVAQPLIITVTASGDEDGDGMPDPWEIACFGGTNVANGGPQDDWDHDGMNNYAEWRAGTNPTNADSRLQVSGFRCQGGTDFVIQWSSVGGKFYAIDASTNLLVGFPVNVISNITATPALNTRTVQVDQAAQRFFRVRVQE